MPQIGLYNLSFLIKLFEQQSPPGSGAVNSDIRTPRLPHAVNWDIGAPWLSHAVDSEVRLVVGLVLPQRVGPPL